MARTKASYEAFLQELSTVDDALADFIQTEGLKSWDEVRMWLESRAERLLAGRLALRAMYLELLWVGREHGVPAFDPLGFTHPSIPVETQARLAVTYRIPEKLRQSTLNHNTPRSDILAARLLGLISEEEFERVPVKFNNEARYTLRRRKRRY